VVLLIDLLAAIDSLRFAGGRVPQGCGIVYGGSDASGSRFLLEASEVSEGVRMKAIEASLKALKKSEAAPNDCLEQRARELTKQILAYELDSRTKIPTS